MFGFSRLPEPAAYGRRPRRARPPPSGSAAGSLARSGPGLAAQAPHEACPLEPPQDRPVQVEARGLVHGGAREAVVEGVEPLAEEQQREDEVVAPLARGAGQLRAVDVAERVDRPGELLEQDDPQAA